MSLRAKRRLRAALPVVTLFVAISLVWDGLTSILAPDAPAAPATTVVFGVLIALPLILFESSPLAGRFRRLPFALAVLAKATTYVAALAAIFLGGGLAVGWWQGLTLADFSASLPLNIGAIGSTYLVYLVVIFLRQLDRLLGPGVLARFIIGRYHRPRRERRIFMFVDLEGSTRLAKTLSLEHYYGLVNDFFQDVAEPAVDADGEIYEYVGDEVVISWPYEAGTRNANCVRAFFEMEKAIWGRSGEYIERYGAVPAFKAALHEGEVIAAEMGGIKRVIAFNGEVLNVTARIRSECSRLGYRLLASRPLVEGLELPDYVTPRAMGTIDLRGAGETEIVALG